MSNIQTGAERMPHDLSHLGFLAGQIGRLITISTTPVIAGDSFEMDAVGRSEERFSRNAETDLVCRLLLEKKKIPATHPYSHPVFACSSIFAAVAFHRARIPSR